MVRVWGIDAESRPNPLRENSANNGDLTILHHRALAGHVRIVPFGDVAWYILLSVTSPITLHFLPVANWGVYPALGRNPKRRG